MRLIGADELLKHKENCYDENGHLLYAVGTGNIMRMPTIDAVPVVRCIDCKYMGSPNARGAYGCKHSSAMVDAWINGYCSYGERRNK